MQTLVPAVGDLWISGRSTWLPAVGAVELDALEALHPGAFARILLAALGRYYDEGLAGRVVESWLEQRETLAGLQREVEGQYQEEFAAIRQRYETLCVEYLQRFSALSEEIAVLWEKMRHELQLRCSQGGALPEAEGGDELGEGLYNSRWGYLEQLEAYRAFCGE